MLMIGAVAGDIIGSVYEWRPTTRTDFPLFDQQCQFTDDTVMTVAVADAILTGSDYGKKLKEWYHYYPDRGYGPLFARWAASDSTPGPYSSGNGSAMRVSPVGWAFNSLEDVLREARLSALPSHSHPDGIAGAQAVAAAVYMARTGGTKAEIKTYIERSFGYRLNETLAHIREHNRPWVTCPSSVPQAITAFLLSTDLEDGIRKAISLGGDADTVACIAGAVAEAFYGGVPEDISRQVSGMLDDRLLAVIEGFNERFFKAQLAKGDRYK